jgi:hypothetical protein
MAELESLLHAGVHCKDLVGVKPVSPQSAVAGLTRHSPPELPRATGRPGKIVFPYWQKPDCLPGMYVSMPRVP